MNKLGSKHILPYIPYDLMVCWRYRIRRIEAISNTSIWFKGTGVADIENVKLILHPLSDLSKKMECNGDRFIPAELLKEQPGGGDLWRAAFYHDGNLNIKELEYGLFECLVRWHFDVFSLIKKGLAVDINSIKNYRTHE